MTVELRHSKNTKGQDLTSMTLLQVSEGSSEAKQQCCALQESQFVFIYLTKTKQSACLILANSGRNVKLQHEPFHCKLFELLCWYLPACRGSGPPTGTTQGRYPKP